MPTSKVQCHGCEKWFKPRGLSQHVSKTQERRCRDALAVSRAPCAPSTIPQAATQMPLSANRASPVSIGGPPDHENDLAGHDQPSDPEIAVTQ
ncbi:hypothetical protein V8E52_000112, partial [Russula decolorans]